jgi:hypothetical protein
LGEGELQALTDGELPPPERVAAETHLAGCPACAAALRGLQGVHERAATLLARADVPAPVAQATMSMRARRLRAGRWAEARRTLARAAVLVVALAGVAVAVPSTGVREWIQQAVLPARKAPLDPAMRPASPAPAAPAQRPAAAEVTPRALGIHPDGGVVRLSLTRVPPQVEVRVHLVDGEVGGLLARGDASSRAQFASGAGKLGLDVAGARDGVVEVQLPRGARKATLEVNGRLTVAKDGDALRVLTPQGEGPVVRVGG